MSAPNVAKISASIDKAGLSIEGLTIDLQVNTVATAYVTFVKTGEPVKPVVNSEVLAEIAELQAARLAGVKEPDTTITASDGNGGNITFKGYLAAPVLNLATDSTQNSFRVLAVDAMLNGLDLSIYRAAPPSSRPDEDAGGLRAMPSATTGDVPKLLTEITDELLANKDTAFSYQEDPGMRALLEHQHEINMGQPMTVWKAILGASEATYESWNAAANANSALADTMTTRTAEIMCQATSGFWGVFNALMASYQMFYQPNPNGSGKLQRADIKVKDAGLTAKLSASQLGLADGSPYIIQLGGVVMVANSMVYEGNEKGGSPTIAAQYPSPLLSGYIHREPPPQWLIGADGVPILNSEIDSSPAPSEDPGNTNLSLTDYEARKKEQETYSKSIDLARTNVMSELCRVMFESLQLENSSVSVMLPLDFKLLPGRRYTFEIADGGSFKGFLQSVKHKVDLSKGSQLDSYTQLMITHVRF